MWFYSDTGPRGPMNIGLLMRLDPNDQYRKHLENWFFLKFVIMNSTIRVEVWQANKELGICDKKLKYWEHNYRFDDKKKLKDIDELKKKWNMK